jgi:hypothetical protein
VFINAKISVETLNTLSTEPWSGNIGLNSGNVSVKVTLFILTSKYSHIVWTLLEDQKTKKTVVASNQHKMQWYYNEMKGKQHTCYRVYKAENG